MNYVRRFVFVHYADLLEVRFRQLEKVTDKLYVFVPAGVEAVPFWLVRQMQDMGRDLSWVDVGDADYSCAQTLLAFHAGTLHEQVDPGVEFAILSDAEGLDALVAYIQAAGRHCVRVKRRGSGAEGPSGKTAPAAQAAGRPSGADDGTADASGAGRRAGAVPNDDHEDLDLEAPPPPARAAMQNGSRRPSIAELLGTSDPGGERSGADDPGADGVGAVDAEADDAGGRHARGPSSRRATDRPRRASLREPLDRPVEADPAAVVPLAEGIVRKLVRSGSRPADLTMLRSYILLHGPDAAAGRYVDEVIDAMAEKGEIELAGEEVRYGF